LKNEVGAEDEPNSKMCYKLSFYTTIICQVYIFE